MQPLSDGELHRLANKIAVFVRIAAVLPVDDPETLGQLQRALAELKARRERRRPVRRG